MIGARFFPSTDPLSGLLNAFGVFEERAVPLLLDDQLVPMAAAAMVVAA